jgi:hypothetical protein
MGWGGRKKGKLGEGEFRKNKRICIQKCPLPSNEGRASLKGFKGTVARDKNVLVKGLKI